MTRIAYIVSAYKLPAQLERMLRRLARPGRHLRGPRRSEDASRGVRRDGRALPRPRRRLRAAARSHWGGFGHVRATLKGLDRLVAAATRTTTRRSSPARTTRSARRPRSPAARRRRREVVHVPLAASVGAVGAARRPRADRALARHHLPAAPPRAAAAPEASRWARAYGGGAYWCLEKSLVHYVHGFLRANPEYVRFFEHVFVPDELFFQTIIMNSELRDTVENDNLRYLDWSREPAPAVFAEDDLPALLGSGALFARKFDETIDSPCSTRSTGDSTGTMTVRRRDASPRPRHARRAAEAPGLGREPRERPLPARWHSYATSGRTGSSGSRSPRSTCACATSRRSRGRRGRCSSPCSPSIIFTIVFGRLAGLRRDGIPYAVFDYSGDDPLALRLRRVDCRSAEPRREPRPRHEGLLRAAPSRRCRPRCPGSSTSRSRSRCSLGMIVVYGVTPGAAVVLLRRSGCSPRCSSSSPPASRCPR